MAKENFKKFLSEIQMLKRVRHEGVTHAGVLSPDSLGEHVAVTSQIAFVLAKMEGADAYKCATMSLFHDNGEARIGDSTWVQARYLDTKLAEEKAEIEHFANLPEEISREITELVSEKMKEKQRKRLSPETPINWN